MKRFHDMPFGAALPGSGEARVLLELDGLSAAMQKGADGWHESIVTARAGARDRFRLADDVAVPDPASRGNPDDVRRAAGGQLQLEPGAVHVLLVAADV